MHKKVSGQGPQPQPTKAWLVIEKVLEEFKTRPRRDLPCNSPAGIGSRRLFVI